MDWAEEIVAEFYPTKGPFPDAVAVHLAEALRKARAYGMRDAAKMCDAWAKSCSGQRKRVQFLVMGDEFRARASQIERGEI